MERQGWRSSADGPANASMYDRFIVCQAGQSWRACVRRAGTMGLSEDDGFWSAFAATSEVEQLQASTMQKNTGIQLLLKILQERRRADGAVERARGIADRMAGREDERPPPGRAGPRSWRSSSTSASVTRKSRWWPLAGRTWPTQPCVCVG